MCSNNMRSIFYLLSLFFVGVLSGHAQDFRVVTDQSFEGAYYGDCAVIDINGDAYPDLIYSGIIVDPSTGRPNSTIGNTSVFLNEAGRFSLLNDEISKVVNSAIAVGDLNGDGLMDFAITGIRQEPGIPVNTRVFEIYYNLGNNTFRKREDTGIDPTIYGSIQIADFNGDGRQDIFVNGQGLQGGISKVYFQQEDGSFVLSESTFLGSFFSGSAVFDADGDGNLDILVAGFIPGGSATRLYLNKGNGVFVEQETAIIDVHFPSISVADFEGDGDLDLLISGVNLATNERVLKLYLNDGQGNFTPSTFEFGGMSTGACALVDYNNDGFLDVFAIGANEHNEVVALFYDNQNNESFVLNEVNSDAIQGLSMSKAVWLDYDNDGDLDLFITGFTSGNESKAILYENTFDPDGYCPVTADYGVEPITFVKMADLENRTDARIGGSAGYENFTAMEANVQVGQTYTLHVQGNTNIPPPTQEAMVNDIRVFIDWNQDGQFDPATEYYAASLSPSTGEDDVEVTFQIAIPADAVIGKTRMRIIKDMWTGYEEGEDEDACNNAYYGQVEDYTLHITSEPVQPACNNEEPGLTPGDTGCITMVYNGQQVTYTTVRAADGTIWLQQNLGSEQVATAVADSTAYGDFFQWGRWDDGHQNKNSPVASLAANPNNPLGARLSNGEFFVESPRWWAEGNTTDTWNATRAEDVTATDGCDPCKALGEGWSLPTKEDWIAVLEAESIDNADTAFESNLRLTAAGARGTTGWYGEGRGYYWSKTVSQDNGTFSKYVYISSMRANPEAGAYRHQGSSVRCIFATPQTNEGSVRINTLDNVAAEITRPNGTLQLEATVLPAESNQEVRWSIVEGANLGRVNVNGLVLAIGNGTVKVRATSVEDPTKFDELDVVIAAPTLSDYCIPEEDSSTYTLPIFEFTFDDTTQTSGDQTNATPPYEDFTAVVVEAKQGETYTVTVKGKTDGQDNILVKVYIDYNHDLIFSEEETIGIGFLNNTGNERGEVTGQIEIPMNTLTGPTRMRVVSMYNSPDSKWVPLDNIPCPTGHFLGQVEDYTINIKSETPTDSYCEPEVGNGSYTVPIYEFTFDGTTQTSNDAINQAPPYEDFTAVVVEAEQGETYTVSVKGKTQEQDNYLVKAYIDFNHDFQFSESESIELGFLNNIGGGNGELTATITIPADALVGQTRMRIVNMYHNPASTMAFLENVPCPVGYYLGQVEDYTLDIKSGIPVTSVEVTTANNSPAEITTENGTLQLLAQVLPTQVNQQVVWSITEGETLARIDQNGVLTAIGNGEVKVRATAVQDATKFGEITVTINIEVLRCPPVALSVGQIGEEQATLIITSNATAFEIAYGIAGFERGTGTSITQASHSQLIEGLTAETSYDVYVRVAGCDTWEKITFETIKLKEQRITVEDVRKVYGDAPFITGETTSHLPLAYTVSNTAVAVIEHGLLVIKGAGETEVIINQAGNEEFLAAAEVRFTLQVEKAPLTVRATDQTKVYNGTVYEEWTVSYEGFVYGEEASVLTGELHYAGTALEAIQVGTYPIEVSGYESVNYEIQYQAGTLEITKARLDNLVFDSGSFLYDGTPKSIYITQTLPEGVTVTYEGNEQVEIGSHTVKAILAGGVNYENRELEATMTIRHQLAGLTFEDATFVYDGTEHALAVSGELPEGVTVTYQNNGKIDAGRYQVTATILGGEHYGNLVLTANLIINKATLDGIVFEDDTFSYDGTPKYIYVSGSIPREVTVEHSNNGKTNVGRYEVEAKILGGTNYVDKHLTAILTIEKATQVITFDEIETLILAETDDFQLQARSNSALPLKYTYEYSGTKSAAEVSESGWVTLKKVGEVTITVTQDGDANHIAAEPVRRVLRIVNNDATIHELWIENEYYEKPQKEIYHFVDCEDLRTSVQVRVVVDEGAQVQPSNEFTIDVPKPGLYKQTVTITSQNGKVVESYVLVVEKAFAFKDIAVKKFNNTLLINKNPQTNGGYHFVGFQWFKNGDLVSDEQVYSVGNSSLLDYKDVYHALVTTKEGEVIHVCPMDEVEGQSKEIQLYPNPVVLGQKATLVVKGINMNLRGIPVKIYNLGGQLLHTVSMEGEVTEILLPQTLPSGMYVAVFELNGHKESIKFLVKK